jgi:hypothetical protein
MSVVNVKVAYIRPQYDNLKEWMEDEYIGRRGLFLLVEKDFRHTIQYGIIHLKLQKHKHVRLYWKNMKNILEKK